MPPPDRPGKRPLVPVPGVLGPDEVAPDDEAPDEAPAPDAAPPAPPDVPASNPEGEPGADRFVLPPEPGEEAAARWEATEPVEPEGVPSAEDAAAETGAPEAESAPPPSTTTAVTIAGAKEATQNRVRQLGRLVVRYVRRHLPETPAPVEKAEEAPPKLKGKLGRIMPVLAITPWILGGLFALTFVWAIPGAPLAPSADAVALLRVLAVSGLIGFGTNWLAITMLFQPREKRVLIPQGLIPAQRERVIYRLAQAISKELINEDIIKEKIRASGVIGRYRDMALGVVRGVVEDPDFRGDLKKLASGYVTDVLASEPVRKEIAAVAVRKVEEQAGQGLGGVALRLYRTFAEDDFQRRVDRAIAELPTAVEPFLDRIDHALDRVPAKVEERADEIERLATRAVLSFVGGLDVRAMIVENAHTYDEAQLERILKSTSNEQLDYIKYLGGVLGVLGGLVIWQPVWALAGFTALTLALWGLDEALVRARRAREGRAS